MSLPDNPSGEGPVSPLTRFEAARPAASVTPLNWGPAARLFSQARTPLYRNAYSLIVSAASTSGLGVLYWILAARYYPADVVGLNAAALSAFTLLAGISQLSLNNALNRYLPLAGPTTTRLVTYAYLVCLATSLTVGFIFGLGLNLWLPALKLLGAGPVWLLVFAVVNAGWCLFSLQDSVFTGLRQAFWVPVENIAYATAKILLLLGLARYLQHLGLFASWTLPALLSLAPFSLLIFRRLIPAHIRATAHRAQPVRLRQVARFAAGNHLGSLFYLTSTNLLPVLVTNLAGPAANAYFYLPWMIATNLQLIALSMATSMTVEATFDAAGITSYFWRALKHTARLLAPIVAAVLVGATFVLRAFGAEYALQGSALLRLLALSMLPNIVVVLSLGLARAQNRVGRIVLAEGVLCLLLLASSTLLVPRLGVAGVGWAALGSQSVVAGGLMLTQLRSRGRAA